MAAAPARHTPVWQARRVAHPPPRLTPDEFDAAVEEALGLIPESFQQALRRVAIFVEPECPPGEDEVLGVYHGVPLTERFGDVPGLPDRIVIYQGPLERMCATREELLDEIAVTVIHEVAHLFGIDDKRLHELGWG